MRGPVFVLTFHREARLRGEPRTGNGEFQGAVRRTKLGRVLIKPGSAAALNAHAAGSALRFLP
jgi:hypothetical protein